MIKSLKFNSSTFFHFEIVNKFKFMNITHVIFINFVFIFITLQRNIKSLIKSKNKKLLGQNGTVDFNIFKNLQIKEDK